MSGQTAEFKALTIMVSAAVVKIKYHALGKTACEPPSGTKPGDKRERPLQRRLIFSGASIQDAEDGAPSDVSADPA